MRRKIALTGNPNVGKSTIFNALTGLRQHTGNWSGVTVCGAEGYFSTGGLDFVIADLPGIYSFDIRSEEEAVTRDYIIKEDFDYLLLVCDATCLERGLHLLRQASALLKGRKDGKSSEQTIIRAPCPCTPCPCQGTCSAANHLNQDTDSNTAICPHAGVCPCHAARSEPQIILCVNLCDEAERKGVLLDFPLLEQELGIPVAACRAREKGGLDDLKRILVQLETPSASISAVSLDFSPDSLAAKTVTYTRKDFRRREERLDRLLTGSFTGGLIMIAMLTFIFWLTITGANYPSALLWDFFFSIETRLAALSMDAGLPQWFTGAFIYGVFRVVAWIVSVMLPPMAIFFPLFTLLEDLGYLPRVAFNMDGAFHKCKACGKQCLTMAMGLGCNAAGVVGCRIIDSPRERLIAILTNSLVPCNGRFPLLITMISLFLIGGTGSLLSALILTAFILLGVGMTLGSSFLLSKMVLKGVPSSFTLELPPYRPPQVGKVIVRSIFDRTLFVLGRAVMVAAPAGLFIWILANMTVGDTSLLLLLSGFLDPFGKLMGLDGIILMAFILGFPANEIVLPIILMAYLQTGYLVEMNDTGALLALLTAHGWTIKTAVCMAIFTLFHWPCSTTCLTIKKETGSLKWTAIAAGLPTLIGILLCILTSGIFHFFTNV